MRLRNIPGSGEIIAESRFAERNPESRKGKWNAAFGNENPVWIEIGMGKGRFLMNQAHAHPEVNLIGIEMYSSVLVRAVQKIEEEDALGIAPENCRMIRMDARNLEDVFAPREVGKIFLNFSDPWPKARHESRRLTSPQFLLTYQAVLSSDGSLEFKTDNRPLFEYSLGSLRTAGWQIAACTFDLHHDTVMAAGNIMTEYEERFSKRGKPICKLTAKLPQR